MRRTEMLRVRWSRSKWIINFLTREDTGQRLRNSLAECFTIDASSFLYIIADAWKEEDLKFARANAQLAKYFHQKLMHARSHFFPEPPANHIQVSVRSSLNAGQSSL